MKRVKMLAKLHVVAKRNLAMDDDMYRGMLEERTGKRSAADLTDAELRKVLDHVSKLAGQAEHPGRPNNADSSSDRATLLGKIEALLTELKLPWNYAAAMAKRAYKKERLEWCDADELRGVIAGLVRYGRRHGQSVR